MGAVLYWGPRKGPYFRELPVSSACLIARLIRAVPVSIRISALWVYLFDLGVVLGVASFWDVQGGSWGSIRTL